MGIFKRLIIRLFHIRSSDLPDAPEPHGIDSDLKSVIHNEIRAQFTELMENDLLPEIRRMILQQNTKEKASSNSTNVSRPKRMRAEKESPIAEEFPIVDDKQIQSIKCPPIKIRKGTKKDGKEEEILPLEDELRSAPKEILKPARQAHKLGIDKPIRIGIDFGTTKTAVAIKIGDDLPIALPLGIDGVTQYIPSVVFFQPGKGGLEERVLVGEDAESIGDEAKIIRSVKRCFACTGNRCKERKQKDNSAKRFPWCKGNGEILIDGKDSISPLTVAYFIVHKALDLAINRVQEEYQIDLTSGDVYFLPLNIGCGANFGLEQREIIRAVAEKLGFHDVKIENVVEEPILAGIASLRFVDDPLGRSLIYDFGGGTLDIAVIDVDSVDRNRRITVLATAGENWLGGDDIDSLVYKEFVNQISRSLSLTPAKVEGKLGTIERAKLRRLARTAKERLSTINKFADTLPSDNFGPLNLDLTRKSFESILAGSPLVDDSIQAILRALKLTYAFEIAKRSSLMDYSSINNLRLEQAKSLVKRVILVGGVTKIPYIRNRLIEIFGPETIISESIIEPVTAVVIGAAYPRDPQHYSISVPPFGFYLEYGSDRGTQKRKRKVLIKAFEYYQFHEFWYAIALPLYSKSFNVESEYFGVKLIIKKGDDEEEIPSARIGHLEPGRWKFSISLDGTILLQKSNGTPTELGRIPSRFRHPLQNQIFEEKKKKLEEDRPKDNRTLEESYRDMRNEN